MTPLRDQLQAAREEYRQVRYPGNLAQLLVPPSAQSIAPPALHPLVVGTLLAFAASIVIVLGRPLLKDTVAVQESRSMGGTIEKMAPISSPRWLEKIEKPVVSSGQFIVNVGRDLAHHADALIHMG